VLARKLVIKRNAEIFMELQFVLHPSGPNTYLTYPLLQIFSLITSFGKGSENADLLDNVILYENSVMILRCLIWNLWTNFSEVFGFAKQYANRLRRVGIEVNTNEIETSELRG
jgi:hypothetical protein